MAWIGIFMALSAIAIIIKKVLNFVSKRMRCSNCKRFLGMERIDTRAVGEEEILILMDEKDSGIEESEMESKEKYIPGKRTTYRETFKCKSCGCQRYKVYSVYSA